MILPLINDQFKSLTIMADKSIDSDFLEEYENNIPVKQRKTDDDNYYIGNYVNPHGSVLDEEQPLDLSINKKQVPTIYHPQNNGAQTPSGLHPFIQQQGHTTLQPSLQHQLQHQQQQHSMKGQSEQFTPLQYTAHQNDAYMPSQGPKFDQFMTPSNQRREFLDYKKQRHLPSLNQLDGSSENMSTSAVIPVENMSTSLVAHTGNMSTSHAFAMGNMPTFPVISIGNMPISPADPMGNMPESPVDPLGNMSASPTSHSENMSTSPSGPIGSQSTSPTDSMGNDHSILHDINQRPCSQLQPFDAIDGSCSPIPNMAEKRRNDDSIGENENIILAKRPKTDVHTGPLCTSVSNQDLSGDESGHSGKNKDPLSDLTNDQRVVLYTLFLCQDMLGLVYISDADCAGDIDMEVVKELEIKGLVEQSSFVYGRRIRDDKKSIITKSYRENCLLSEIDKDFFIQVASDESMYTYAEMYCCPGNGPRESEDIGPITTMRLIVEGHGRRLPDSVTGEVPACLINDEKECEMFVKFWCKARNTDPITLSDQIPYEKIKNFYSAFTILSEIKNELMEMHLSKKKWSILISIHLSESYSGCENIRWEEKRKNIQQTFKALQDIKEERAEDHWVLLNELEHRDELLTVDKENNKMYFVSEEVRHQVMGYFVLNCLQSKEDYKNCLNLSSRDSLIEYVRPLGYRRQGTERCMYLPKGTEEVFLRRFGIDAICNATPGFDQLENAILSELKIPPVVLKMSQDTKIKFCNFVKGFDEEHEHQQLNRSSLFGSFLIDLNTSEKKEFFTSQPSSPKMSILCTILLSNDYTLFLDKQLKDNIKKTRQTFSTFQRNEKVEDDLLIEELVENDKVLIRNNALNNVKFATDELRHQVMSFFVRTCLVTDEDYINYINLSSVDSLLEYVRVWGYENVEEERCLHLPERIENIYIEKLNVHTFCHVNMEMLCQNSRNLADKLQLPPAVVKMTQETKNKFSNFVKALDEEHKHQMNRSSLLGSFLIELNTSKKREFFTSPLSSPKMNILCTVLLSNNYTICSDEKLKDTIRKTRQTFKAFQSNETVEDDLLIKELVEDDKVLIRNNALNDVQFATDDVRHQVMSYFVRTCLDTYKDYINYIKLSSVDSLLEYVRVWRYEHVEKERCLHLPEIIKDAYIRKVNVDILCHVNLEMFDEERTLANQIKLPSAVLKMTQETRKNFCNFVKGFDEKHKHHQFNRNSLFGSFLIDLNASKKRDIFTSPLSSRKMNILCTILLSSGYALCLDKQLKDTIKETRETFRGFQSNETVEDDLLIKELVDDDKVLMRNNALNNVQFATDDVRHQVMSYFVRTCLDTDEDYINYIKLSSVDSLLEYVRVWGYENFEEERCLHLPEKIKDTYIEKLNVDILCHVNLKMFDRKRTLEIEFHIPIEVFEWDCEARRRYVDCLKKGKQVVHRARAMIVGCAGAGKTTLLQRLQNQNIDKLKEIKSTVGLEVHENIFEIEDNSLKALSNEQNNENKCSLSVVDFAGQCAYYACHQVYLSRRAFYLLVIDLSKPFDGKVDRQLCEQEGTMFSDWTYGQYIIFWLKSIHTYCDDDTPVITIGTHSDRVQNVDESIYDDLLELLKDEPELKMHIDGSRCFHIGFPWNDNEPIDRLTDIEECIASIALEDRWKETIPAEWALCEAAFRENKQRGKKMISLSNFKTQVSSKMSKKDEETFDMLRFYNDVGSILHFNEEDLKDKTIIDVQWFVNCFKNIITDPKHARKVAKDDTHWQFYDKSGYLSEELLYQIWRKTKMDIRKCKPTLKYMQRLGLVAVGKKFHYIPCMNKLDVGDGLKKYLSNLSQKSSVLIFKFEFLPHFFYFRLVVACMVDANWAVVEDTGQKYVFKSAVCFRFQDHLIVLAVTMTTIQIQLFRQGDLLSFDVTKKIRDTIIEILKRLTNNFHKKTLYSKGYQCSKQNVLEELASCFLLEDEIYKKGQITCPRHGGMNHHFVKEKELLLYWMDGEKTGLHDKEVQTREKLHRCLIADLVNNYLDVSVDNGHVFRTWKQYFRIQYSAPRYHSTTVDEDFNTLEKDGKLSLNNYEILKEILKNVDHRALQRIKEHEEELKRTL